MKKNIAIAFTTALLLAGCGTDTTSFDDLTSGFTGNNSNGTDTLTIRKTTGDNINIIWDKKYSGYSEAAYSDNKNDKRGRYFISSNTTTKQTFECIVKEATSSNIYYTCTNNNPIAPMYETKSFRFESGKEYYFWVNKGTSLEKQPVSATLLYNGNNQSVTIQ